MHLTLRELEKLIILSMAQIAAARKDKGISSTIPKGTAAIGGTDSVWFSAGIDNEQQGLIGVLRKP